MQHSNPRITTWLLTYVCNLSCNHCYISSPSRRHLSELSLEDKKKVVDKLVEAGIQGIGILGGEIFSLPNIVELLTYMTCEKGVEITIETNGTLLTDHNCERLAALSNLEVVGVSFEGPYEQVNDMIRGNGSFLQAEKGIALLKQYDIPFFVDVTLSRLNSSYIDEMCQFALRQNASGIAFGDLLPVGRGENLRPYVFTPADEKLCVERIWAAHRKYRGTLQITINTPFAFLIDPLLISNKMKENDIYCGMGTKVILDPAGNVLPCQYINDPVGNILDSWEDAWFSPKMQHYREVPSSLEGKCKLCKYRSACGGCRAAALAYTGNLCGEDPRCWYENE